VPDLTLSERYLGLITAGEKTWNAEQVKALANAAAKNIDLDFLLGSGEIRGARPVVTELRRSKPAPLGCQGDPVRIGIARDQAFSFYYQSSLDALHAAGTELMDFSPLSDHSLPSSLDGLYIGGGYPEVFAEKLGKNQPFLESLREFVASGRPVYAECGGLMYLSEELTTLDGRTHKMAAVLPLAIEMLNRLDGFGYTEVELLENCLIGERGSRLRGHSFHYSHVTRSGDVARRYRSRQVLTGAENYEGYCRGNVLASYIHASFAASPDAASHFVRNCREAKAVAQ
jgi:cobyrinic acid a,c-diamide synthase